MHSLKFPAGSTPWIVDIDSDGDPDLLVGTEAGSMIWYRNNANPQESLEVQ